MTWAVLARMDICVHVSAQTEVAGFLELLAVKLGPVTRQTIRGCNNLIWKSVYSCSFTEIAQICVCKPNLHLISTTFSCSLTFSVGGNFVRTLSRDILWSPLLLSQLTAFSAQRPNWEFPFLPPSTATVPHSAAFPCRMFVLSPTSAVDTLPLPVETLTLRLCYAFSS